MKVVCDKCKLVEYGTVDSLSNRGWKRAIIKSPYKITLTRCKNCDIQKDIHKYKYLTGEKP